MSIFGFRTTNDRGLSIELLMDEQPFAKLFPDDPDTKIPYYYFEGDLPLGYWGNEDARIKRIGVCTCGEAGCGSTESLVTQEGDTLVFRNISSVINLNASDSGDGREFRITLSNYNSVIESIMSEVEKYKASIDAVNDQ
jgi:hypothetical protein